MTDEHSLYIKEYRHETQLPIYTLCIFDCGYVYRSSTEQHGQTRYPNIQEAATHRKGDRRNVDQ